MKHARREKWIRRLTASSATVVGALLLALLAFAAALMLPFAADSMEGDVEGDDTVAPNDEAVVWVVFHDGERLTGMVRVYSDAAAATVRAVGYPPSTEIIDGVSVTTAERLYAARGARVAQSIDDGAVVSFSVDGAVALIRETVGTLPMGEVSLSPLQAGDALRVDDGERSDEEQARMHAEVTAAWVKRVLAQSRTAAAWEAWDACCDSRVNVALRETVQQYVSAFDGAPSCVADVADGYAVGSGEYRRYVLVVRER